MYSADEFYDTADLEDIDPPDPIDEAKREDEVEYAMWRDCEVEVV